MLVSLPIRARAQTRPRFLFAPRWAGATTLTTPAIRSRQDALGFDR